MRTTTPRFQGIQRREFLRRGGRIALGSCLLPLGIIAQTTQNTAKPKAKISTDGLAGNLEKLIPKLMLDSAVPGLSIALVRDGKLSWNRGFGFKDNVAKTLVDDETMFEAASVSKTVFAYAVMKLCEKGILGLDKPLTDYSPKPFLEGDPRLKLITARHVLSHTSGFQDWRSGAMPLKIHFTPGEKFDYSGEGYAYLQSVVTHLTGQIDLKNCAQYEGGVEVCATDIDTYLKRNLLTPFGMTSSGYVWNDTFAQHAVRPHDTSGKPFGPNKPTATDAARYASAGGLNTTATDYAKFLIEILDPKTSDTFRLTKKSLAEMLRPQIKLPKGGEIDGADSWALGWAVQQRKTGHVIVHSGGQAGFRSLTMASVERKSGFIILTNSDNGGKIIYNETFGELMNQLLAD